MIVEKVRKIEKSIDTKRFKLKKKLAERIRLKNIQTQKEEKEARE